MAKRKHCITVKVPNQCEVTLHQVGKNNFTVTYGKQKTINLTYEKAAAELGECIMHAVACNHGLDNS